MIGIGMVTKPEEAKYAFVNPYKIVNPGSWMVKKGLKSLAYFNGQMEATSA